MTREFSTRVGKQWRTLRYAVGQPMGFLSSWTTFALTHHILVRSIFKFLGSQPRYWMNGDDVVIGDKGAADRYRLAMDLLGIEISLSKSVLSDDGRSFEFSKRRVQDGRDISPLSWSSLGSEPKVESFEFLSRVSAVRERIDPKATWSVARLNTIAGKGIRE